MAEGVASDIWNKAALLVSDADAISSAPVCSPKGKIFQSKSGMAPHLVASKKENQYVCDDKCLQSKSLGVCSHVVAAACTLHPSFAGLLVCIYGQDIM